MGVASTSGFRGVYNQYARGLHGIKYGGRFPRGTGPELKVIDVAQGPTNNTNTGVLTLVNGVGQGSDFTQRIGRKVCLKSLLINWSTSQAGVSTEAGEVVRMMLIYDSQTNSASLPATTDVLLTADPFSAMNLNNRDRFKILYDKRATLNPAVYTASVLTAGAPVLRFYSKYLKLNHEMIFSGTGSTIGSIQTGSIFSLVITTSGTGSSTYNLTTRLRFLDY